MGRYPDVLILRKYDKLNAKNLLYSQAQLAHLEQELHEIEEEDRSSGTDPRQKFDKRWSSLAGDPASNNPPPSQSFSQQPAQPLTRDTLQWHVFLRLRRVLAEYSMFRYTGCYTGWNHPFLN
jgi:hypothetical protein